MRFIHRFIEGNICRKVKEEGAVGVESFGLCCRSGTCESSKRRKILGQQHSISQAECCPLKKTHAEQ